MSIKSDIEDLKCTLEELNECCDLEDRLEVAEELARLEKLSRGPHTFMVCGICRGATTLKEFGDEWPCPICRARGGTWV